MLECPQCGLQLGKRKTSHGFVFGCATCQGRAATLAVLRKAGAAPAFLREVWTQARDAWTPQVRNCPHCDRRMKQVAPNVRGEPLKLDVCTACMTVWFDASEFESMPREVATPSKHSLSPEAREKAALFRLKSLKEQRAHDGDGMPVPDHAWQWLPGLVGLPVEYDAPKVARLPWATWTLAAFCVLATAHALYNASGGSLTGNWVIDEWGFIPNQWYRRGGLTLITSFFLHGGALHLAANMYFMLIFGDNVEDCIGWVKYLALVFLAHVVGILCHGLFGADPYIPCVGASAGISGIIAYYAVTFPDVRLGFMLRYFLYFRWFRIRAVWALVLYTVLQIVGAAMQVRGFSRVSYLAHLGGLVVGLAAAGIAYLRRKQTRKFALSDDKSPALKRDGIVQSIGRGRRY